MSTVYCVSTKSNVLEAFDTLLKMVKIEEQVKPKEKVLIKPNVCSPRQPSTGAVTKPLLVVHLAKKIRSLGAEPIVAESSIGLGMTEKSFEVSGLKQLCDVNNIKLINMEKYPTVFMDGLEVCATVKEADKIINFPVMKTHKVGELYVTLSLKNLMGFFPSKQKSLLHKQGIEKSIIRFNKMITPVLNIMDATICMEGEGPTVGKPVKLNLLMASEDRVSLDFYCCHIMGIKPPKYIEMAKENGIGESKYVVEGYRPIGLAVFEMPKSDIIHRRFDRQKGELLSIWPFNVAWIKLYKFLRGRTKPKFPQLNKSLCKRCGMCVKICPFGSLSSNNGYPTVDKSKCVKCYACVEVCPTGAISEL